MIDRTWQERAASHPEEPHLHYVTLPLDRYVEACLDHQAGFVSTMFRRFVGPPEAPISFVGRYEHLADDLSLALREAGESFDEDVLRAVPPLNVSGGHVALPAWLEKRVRRVEREAYERFYPGEI